MTDLEYRLPETFVNVIVLVLVLPLIGSPYEIQRRIEIFYKLHFIL